MKFQYDCSNKTWIMQIARVIASTPNDNAGLPREDNSRAMIYRRFKKVLQFAPGFDAEAFKKVCRV